MASAQEMPLMCRLTVLWEPRLFYEHGLKTVEKNNFETLGDYRGECNNFETLGDYRGECNNFETLGDYLGECNITIVVRVEWISSPTLLRAWRSLIYSIRTHAGN